MDNVIGCGTGKNAHYGPCIKRRVLVYLIHYMQYSTVHCSISESDTLVSPGVDFVMSPCQIC